MIDFSGRCGLVLGVSGNNSIGYQVARTLTDAGAAVATTHRPSHRDRSAEVSRRLPDSPHFAVEAGDGPALAAVFAELTDRWGRLDFLVHTLAHGPSGALRRPLTQLSRADFDTVMGVGVHSLIAAAGMAIPLFQKSAAPRIVALTSHGDTHTMPGYHALGISKAALAAAVRYLAAELGPAGVLCNALRFSYIPTEGAQRAIGADTGNRTRELLARTAPTRQPLEGAQVAAMVALLASPAWQNTTGQIITQDGGFAQVLFRTPAVPPTASPAAPMAPIDPDSGTGDAR
jgi:enoyl-[acyl-carrier protein] reductase I